MEDAVRYTARRDRPRSSQRQVRDSRASSSAFSGIIDAVGDVSGRRFKRRSRNSVADLEALIARQRGADPQSIGGVRQHPYLLYILYMLNGRTALQHLQNKRYVDLRPETYIEYARPTWEQGK